MKPQSFLRDMANYVFKQFCSELDEQSLGNLLTIVSTPNERASSMVGGDDDEEDDEEDEARDAYGSEVSEDSDDL